jgi:hypothetical protein
VKEGGKSAAMPTIGAMTSELFCPIVSRWRF